MRRVLWRLAWLLLSAAFHQAAVATARADSPPPPPPPSVTLEFFYNPGCDDCDVIKQQVLPDLRQRFGDAVDLKEYDLMDASNYLHLAQLQERLGIRTGEAVSIYLDGSIYLGGLPAIQQQLTHTIAQILAGALPSAPPASLESSPPAEILRNRVRSYSIGLILGYGLVDGFNPCAFSTLVFFITLLVASGYKGRTLLWVGTAFCASVFATYFLIGFGAFHLIQRLTAYAIAGTILKWLMVAMLALFALLSFRDAWTFFRRGVAREVLLQLPDPIKQRIHRIMRANVTARGLLTGSLLTGFLVTLLESVCTGQLYGPTLVALAMHPELGRRALLLLLLYNLMFIVPLVVVFLAVYAGTRTYQLLDWSRRNVVGSKILLGLLFLALLLLLLRT